MSSAPFGNDTSPLLSEQLFTYDPPPSGVCIDGTPTSGVAAVGMTLAGILGLVGVVTMVL